MAITQYRHSIWTTNDGLPQNTVGAIVQDNDGFVWLGTQEGLVRYDGTEFRVFDRTNTPEIRVNQINQLVVAADGALWAGTRGGGLLRYEDGRFSAWSTEDGLSSDFSMSLYADSDGSVWMGTLGGGINHVSEDAISVFGPEQGLDTRIVAFIDRDSGGKLIIGTREGVKLLDDGVFVPHPDETLSSAYVVSFGAFGGHEWFGTRQGDLFSLADSQLEHIDVGQTGYLREVLQDGVGTLWFAMNGGGLLRMAQGMWSVFQESDGLSSDQAMALGHDSEGGLWIGTVNGLNRLGAPKFTMWTSHEGLPADDIRTVHQDDSGAMWVGTASAGVSVFRDGTWSTLSTDSGLSSNAVLAIESVGPVVWIGTADAGLNRWEDGNVTHVTVDQGLANNEIYALHSDPRGALWVATGNGISIVDGAFIQNLGSQDGLNSPFVTEFADHPDGSTWIATYDGGLNRVVPDSMLSVTAADGLYSDGILSLYQDAEGLLWVGTFGEGLNVVDDDRITGVTSRQGLFDDTIMSILEDAQGFLWFTSNKGIFRAERDALLAVANGEQEFLESESFGLEAGLKSTEANGGQQPAAWRSSDGAHWFPMKKGVASIDPGHILWNEQAPFVHVDGLTVDRVPVSVNESISLAPGSNRLTFSFTAPTYTAPRRVSYEIRMTNSQEAWLPVGADREATFTNLSPGDYMFEVRASNGEGVWNQAGTSLSFTLRPFFYQTLWFKFVAVAALILGLFAAYRARIEQMKARERHLEAVVDHRTRDLREQKEQTERAKEVIEEQAEQLMELDRFKTKFFSNVSHEFRTPLTMLIGPLENILGGVYGPVSESMHRQSEIMLRNAKRLMRLINQLLDLSKLEDGKMALKARKSDAVSFLDNLLESFTPFTEKKRISLKFERDLDHLDVYFEPDKLEKVVFNLLSNAAKFTPEGGQITLSLTEQQPTDSFPKGAAMIAVSDTGQGIPESDLATIFDRFRQSEGSHSKDQAGTGIGLSLVKELVELHQGSISVESEVGEGSTFRFVIPLGRRHLMDDQIVEISEGEDANAMQSEASFELSSKNLRYMYEQDGTVKAKKETPENAPTVLIVEDNQDVREYVASIFDGIYHIYEAEDGAEGLEKAAVHNPDLIISDVNMPRMDGNEMCRRIKSDGSLNHIPVLMLTARASFDGKMEGLEMGADDYMAKPFNAAELTARVKNLITLRSQDRELKILNTNLEAQVQAQLDLIMIERKEYEQQLIVERDRAEASSRMKSTILDNVNHEFRTPLSTILGYSNILVEEAPPELQEFASAIEEGGNRLLKTLNGVIDLADMESFDVDSDAREIGIGDVLDELQGRWEAEASARGLSFEITRPEGHSESVTASRTGLNRVLDLLMDNAIKFTDSGFVRVSANSEGQHITFTVADSGVGIAPENQDRIFEAFAQEETSLDRSHEGIGVGLSVARRIAQLMGGDIRVMSKVGEGSEFVLALPVRQDGRAPDRVAKSGSGSDASALDGVVRDA